MEGFFIYIAFKVEPAENTGILRVSVMFSVCKHPSNLCVGAYIISFMIPTICVSKGIWAHMYRS